MERREALTIRFPLNILEGARETKSEGESLNDLIVKAVEHEIRRRKSMDAHEGIMRIREQIRARNAVLTDSVPLIRAMREGEGRRD